MIYRKSNAPLTIQKLSFTLFPVEQQVAYSLDKLDLSDCSYEKLQEIKTALDVVPLEIKEAPPEKEGEQGEGVVEEASVEESAQEIIRPRIFLPEFLKIKAYTFLTEITMDYVFFFASDRLNVGQLVDMEFELGDPFILRGEVLFSWRYSENSSLLGSKLPYRGAAQIIYTREGERTYFRTFLKKVENLKFSLAASQGASSEEEEGQEDLGELDF